MELYRSQLNEVLKHSNFSIHGTVKNFDIKKTNFQDNFDMYVKQINFDLSPYYTRWFEEHVHNVITSMKKNLEDLINCLTIEDLDRLTKKGYKVVFKRRVRFSWGFMLVKVCPKTVEYKDNDNGERNYLDKRDDFICEMPKNVFAIKTDEEEHMIINKTNINEHL